MATRSRRPAHCEWDPYTRPISTEIAGTVSFEDLVEGASMTETIDEATGIAKRSSWTGASISARRRLKPAIVDQSEDGKIGKLHRGGDARYGAGGFDHWS